jgi:hypothetical protein
MPRPPAVVLMVVGLAVAVFGGYHALQKHPGPTGRSITTVPGKFSRYLTPGSWSIYGQDGTGPYGTALPLTNAVTTPTGAAVALTTPSGLTTLKVNGTVFAPAANFPITAAGTYSFTITTSNGNPVRLLVTPSLHPKFKAWIPLAIDGLVLLAAGTGLMAWDTRRRRQVHTLEAAYTSG